MEVEPSGPGTGVGDVVATDGVSHPRPNPFNPATTIDCSVAADGVVDEVAAVFRQITAR